MNFLAHAAPYLDQPLLAICTGVPDWLSVIDRKIRIRRRMALANLDSSDPFIAAVAAGVIQHIDDDQWFHNSEAFVRSNLELTMSLREQLPGDAGFRPMFLAHILIEVMLDSLLIAEDPSLAERYYTAVKQADAAEIERAVNVISGRPTDRLATTIGRYCDEAFLYDYADDDRLLYRMNQVMHRVGLAELPKSLMPWFADARALVASRRQGLLSS